MFTDVQGSTRLWERAPEATWSALQIHDRILRFHLAEHGGYEVKTEGDAFMVAFSDPVDAVAWCLAVQRALLVATWPAVLLDQPEAAPVDSLDGTPLHRGFRVRMGLHRGEAACVPDPTTGRMDYHGRMVNRAARIAGSAHGGQILVSAEVWAAAADVGDVVVRDLGTHPLRGFDDPQHLFEVLPAEVGGRQFPAVGSARTPRTNLTASRNTFVGRADDLATIARSLEQARLVTVVGTGGTGKTRLSLQYGVIALESYAGSGGVWFCDVTEDRTAAGVVETVGKVVGVAPAEGGDPTADVGAALAARGRMLVILDNFEQVVPHGQATVGRWLSVAPELRFLVTSRQRLQLDGEVVIRLEPLGHADAMVLFDDRARAAKADFAPTPEEQDAIAEIVAGLDRLPLAIELAAARVAMLSPHELLRRLPQRFQVLRNRRRDTNVRQATLRDAIDWSWTLLSPAEQEALKQCAVFRGGFTLDHAEALLDLQAHPDAWVLDVVESLLEKSLLHAYVVPERPQETRCAMYESIRAFCVEKLDADPSAEQVYLRHEVWCLELAEALVTGRNADDRAQLLLEADNLVAVHERAARRGDAETALRVILVLEDLLGADGAPLADRGYRGWREILAAHHPLRSRPPR